MNTLAWTTMANDELADALSRTGGAQALMYGLRPKALSRLVELGMIVGGASRVPQLTTLGQVFLGRLKSGQPIPDLDHPA
jgi:hypothetical protein